MCGLVGMAGDLKMDHRKMFEDLLIVDSLRGKHSTGVASITADGKLSMIKKACLPQELMDHKQYDKVVTFNSRVLIGHNRYATQGAVNGTNAHPFEIGDIVGAHNGTLRRQHLLPEHLDYEVDSENLIHSINKLGFQETIALTDGAFALSVYNKNDNTLQLARNHERPLAWAWDEDGTVLMWASEAWMLSVAAGRQGVKIGKLHDIEPRQLYTWELPKHKVAKLPNPRVRNLTEHEREKKPNPPTHQSTKRTQAGGGNSYGANTTLDDVRLGQAVRFYVVEAAKNGGWIDGIMVNPPQHTVRLYVSKLSDLGQELLDWQGEWEGVISSKVPVTQMIQGKKVDQSYVTLDKVRLKKLQDGGAPAEGEPEEESEEGVVCDTVPGPGGREITKAAFESLTKYGCAMCQGWLDIEDEVEWDGDAAFCSDCWEGHNPSENVHALRKKD